MAVEVDLREVADNAGNAVIVADPQENIIYWNASATRIFGYTREEALASQLKLIVPERFRARHSAGFHKTMTTGMTTCAEKLLHVPATHKDGHPMRIAFTVALLFTPEHKVKAIAAIMHDETELRRQTDALQQRIRELEAR